MFGFRLSRGFKNKKIKSLHKEYIEPQEVFLDNLAQKKEEELGISEKKFEIPLPQKIIKGFLVLSIILIFILFGKTFQLQIFNNKELSAQARENKFIVSSLQASRGVIYDSNGNQLVFNKPSFDLILDKKKLPQTEEDRKNILKAISEIIKQNQEDLEKKINSTKDQIVFVLENLDYQTLILLKTKIDDFPAFEIRRNSSRDYKDGKIFAHLIGYISQINDEEFKKNANTYSLFDRVGRTGIEKSYEEVLRKKPGKVQIKRDAYGNLISKEVVFLPESGESLILWLDSDLQKKITEEMEKIFEVVGVKKGAAIAIDPKTGGIMALVSLPGFDNNLFNREADSEALKNLLQDQEQPLYNRAITGQYPTGSTIKPLTASAALQEKLISPSKQINCQGKITIPHQYNPAIVYEYNDWTTHGMTDMRKAIAESCNVYFYTIGGGYKDQPGLGPSRIKKYLELFGWGEKSQIDLPEESKGFIPSPSWKKETKKEDWWDGDTYNLSIGQGGILITPLQVATSFVAIANGGTLYKPIIVKKIIDSNKNVVEEISPTVLRKDFIDPQNLQVIREGMRMAVTGEGAPQASAPSLNYLPVKIAIKTGTAETSKPDYYNKWITVFAPYDDPQIVLTIMIESVRDIQPTAIPVAKEVLNW